MFGRLFCLFVFPKERPIFMGPSWSPGQGLEKSHWEKALGGNHFVSACRHDFKPWDSASGIICEAQSRMQLWGSLFKSGEEWTLQVLEDKAFFFLSRSLSLSLDLLWCFYLLFNVSIRTLALTGVAQWIECQPARQKLAGLIPSQGTCLGCGPDPQLGAWERQLIYVSLTHRCFSPSLSLSLPLSLKIKK